MTGIINHRRGGVQRRRLRGHASRFFCVVTVSTALIIGACDFNREAPPCECPHLLEVVESINWVPGLEVERLENSRMDGDLFVQTVWSAPANDGQLRLERITEALALIGFDIDTSEAARVTASQGNLEIWAGANDPVGELPAELFVRVTYDGEDGPEVVDQLEPLREALAEP